MCQRMFGLVNIHYIIIAFKLFCFTVSNVLLFHFTLYRPNGIILVIYYSILFHFYTFGLVMLCLCAEVVMVCKIILDIQVSRR